jgi:hypothetical protein
MRSTLAGRTAVAATAGVTLALFFILSAVPISAYAGHLVAGARQQVTPCKISFGFESKSHCIGYVNYDNSGFTGTKHHCTIASPIGCGNIFRDAIVGGPASTATTTKCVKYLVTMSLCPVAIPSISFEIYKKFDTLILFEVCDIATSLTPTQRQAINNFIEGGRKVLLFDADRCFPGGVSPAGPQPSYGGLAFAPLKTIGPGPASEAGGTMSIIQSSGLTTNFGSVSWNGDVLGDANTLTAPTSANWCEAAGVTGANHHTKVFFAYLRKKTSLSGSKKGLVIYNGADNWDITSKKGSAALTRAFKNELKHKFNPDGLPCGHHF